MNPTDQSDTDDTDRQTDTPGQEFSVTTESAPESLPPLRTQSDYDAFVNAVAMAEAAGLLQAATTTTGIGREEISAWVAESGHLVIYDFAERYDAIMAYGADVDDVDIPESEWRDAPAAQMARLASRAFERDLVDAVVEYLDTCLKDGSERAAKSDV